MIINNYNNFNLFLIFVIVIMVVKLYNCSCNYDKLVKKINKISLTKTDFR